mmetsp:Transcript_13667/g.18700  ORF Transcript_13667/g.18700 Transcript_13667/m.18700 type:complete len:148 (+) Transcript_13667:1147-1590(+)
MLASNAYNEKRPHKGTFSVHPHDSWIFYEGRSNKYGWIAEYRNRTNSSPESVSSFTQGSLIFRPHWADIEEAKEALKSSSNYSNSNHLKLKVLLQIVFLRTYRNAGTAEVRLDGKPVALLDALYPNFMWFLYSMGHFAIESREGAFF